MAVASQKMMLTKFLERTRGALTEAPSRLEPVRKMPLPGQRIGRQSPPPPLPSRSERSRVPGGAHDREGEPEGHAHAPPRVRRDVAEHIAPACSSPAPQRPRHRQSASAAFQRQARAPPRLRGRENPEGARRTLVEQLVRRRAHDCARCVAAWRRWRKIARLLPRPSGLPFPCARSISGAKIIPQSS